MRELEKLNWHRYLQHFFGGLVEQLQLQHTLADNIGPGERKI
jgi:hypothetical protein